MEKLKVYIASPYTIGNQLENTHRQIHVAEILMNNGIVPFTPLFTHYHHELHPRSNESWLEWDFEWLKLCDCVLRLDGESRGADEEEKYAKSLGIPIFYDINELIIFTNDEKRVKD